MFDYKKYYVFSVDKFIADVEKLGHSEEDIRIACKLWANEIDGKRVMYIDEKTGVCDGCVLHPDWCEEIDPYDM